MSVTNTRALVLRTSAYGETSQIARLLTERWGVVAFVARGVRRTGGRSSSHLEPFTSGEVTLHYRDGRDLQTLHAFHADRVRMGLATPAARFAAASALVELLLRAAPEAPQRSLLQSVEQALDRMERCSPERVPEEILASLWQTVAVLGFEPALQQCVVCGRDLGDAEMGRFDFARGGVRCEACGAEGAGPRVGPGARAELAAFLRTEGPASPPAQHVLPHLRLLADFITYHVAEGRALRSLDMLRGLLS